MPEIDQYALMSALYDMYDEGLDIEVLKHWRTGFPIETSNN